jgi:hypothetical protein
LKAPNDGRTAFLRLILQNTWLLISLDLSFEDSSTAETWLMLRMLQNKVAVPAGFVMI